MNIQTIQTFQMKRIIAAVATLLLCLVGTTVSAQSGY